MRAMHWTYKEYQRTPTHIIEEIAMFLATDNKITLDMMKEKNG